MSETGPEGPRLELDVREIFTPLDDDEWGPSLEGRPDDHPGYENLSVLQTPGGRYRAGKSYRPDSSGLRRASKVDDYSLGTDFLCNTVWFESLEEVFTLLQKLSTDPSKFVVRGYLSDQADEMRQHLITGETGYLVRRRTVRHHHWWTPQRSITAAPDAGPRRRAVT